MADINKITVQLAKPRGSFPGKIAEGYYVVNEDTVTLAESNGVSIDSYKLSRKLGPGEDARGAACNLLRSRYSGRSGDFNRTLVYPPLGRI
jgi:hypothetical protein